MSETASSRFRIAGIVLALFVLATVGILMFAQQRSLGKEGASRKAEVEAGPRVHTLVVGGSRRVGPLLPGGGPSLGLRHPLRQDRRLPQGDSSRQGQPGQEGRTPGHRPISRDGETDPRAQVQL